MSELKKIVVIGPESTGKSTLCELLAKHYNTLWCPEYAREYLLKHCITYTYDDLLSIAKGQLKMEDEYASSIGKRESSILNEAYAASLHPFRACPEFTSGGWGHIPLLFVDTDMYIMKVWCEYVFHQCHPFILEQIATRKYDLYLLCNPDLPWEPDVLREYPDEAARVELYSIYKNLLLNQPTPFIEITGNYEERLQKAIEAVDDLLSQAK